MKMAVLLAVLALVFPSFAVITPSGDTTGAADYTAITEAIAGGGTVELGAGTFYVNKQIELTSAVTLKGAGRDVTIIMQTLAHKNTNPSARVFRLNHENAVLQGITITKGYLYALSPGGAGVLIDGNGGRVLDCRVTDNETSMNTCGAVYITSSKGIVARTIIDKNKNGDGYSYSGSGIYMSAGKVENCLIAGNTNSGTSRGAGDIYVGGVRMEGGSLSNCTVTANSGRNAGGVSVKSTSCKVVNCIIWNNKSTSGTSTAAGLPECNSGAYGAAYVNCLMEDPSFADAANGDYSLRGISAAIDRSEDDGHLASGTDIVGNPRCLRRVDLGCYENQDDETTLLVTATPSEYGTVTPAYGTVGSLSAGSTKSLTAPASFQQDGMDITCDGWVLYSQDAETLEWTQIGASGADNKITCSYTHPDPAVRTKLVWQWKTACGITATANPGGRVSATSQALAIGETATIEAFPESGVFFSRWTGDVPKGMERDNPLVFTVDAAHAVTAHFIAETTYVRPKTDAAAAPVAPYLTRETAATSINDFAEDLIDGCKVIVMDGVNEINQSVRVNFAVTFEGEHGYTNATVKQTLAHDSNKNTAARVFSLNNEQAILRGLTITKGFVYGENHGAGVRIESNGGQVRDCRVTDNEASMNSYGAGIYIGSSKGVVTHCVIDNNKNPNVYAFQGAGIAMSAGHVDNCLVFDNSLGGASRKESMQAGGVYASGGTVSNCTIVANTGWDVGGVTIGAAGVRFVNCIVANNKLSAAAHTSYVGAPEYASDCFYGNAWHQHPESFVNCLFPTGTALPNNSCSAGDPKFADEANDDYRIGVGSAAIKAGVNGCWTEDDTDLDGIPRLSDGKLDIGCYAYVSSGFGCDIDASAWQVLAGGVVTLFAKFDESVDAAEYESAWQLVNEKETIQLAAEGHAAEVTFARAGRYTVTLVVSKKADGGQVFEKTMPAALVVSPVTAYAVVENPNACYPFDTLETASTNVHEVLLDLMSGSTLMLGAGTHILTKTIDLTKNIVLQGEGREATTLKLNRNGKTMRVFSINSEKATVRGVTIKGGGTAGTDGLQGAGVFFGDQGGIVEDCRLTGNTAGMNGSGGGAYLGGSDAILRRCVVDGNSIYGTGNRHGCGVSVDNGLVESCLVMSNSTAAGQANYDAAYGGGIYVAKGTVRNCTVIGNEALFGGGVYASGGKVMNTIMQGNALWERSKRPTASSSGPWVYPEPAFETSEWGGVKSLYANCLTPDDPALDDSVKAPNATCLVGDPLFVDAANLDFHLSKGSPAINAGAFTAAMENETDLDGNPRVKHVKRYRLTGEVKRAYVDLGCYETEWRGPGFVLWVR